jgi:hypothetical protein
MMMKTTHARKPNLLVVVSLLVAVGFLATSMAQAADSFNIMSTNNEDSSQVGGSENWWQSIWGLNLSEKLGSWRPMISVHDDYEGMNLARPFGKAGPALQVTSSLPDSVARSLRDGGDSQIGAFGNGPDAYLFFQKRW